ncbi:hypothetical protein [Mesorhizobium sp. WSM3866]|nr:hypothetical protein [Mesorhizobium sp. WSM3866]
MTLKILLRLFRVDRAKMQLSCAECLLNCAKIMPIRFICTHAD